MGGDGSLQLSPALLSTGNLTTFAVSSFFSFILSLWDFSISATACKKSAGKSSKSLSRLKSQNGLLESKLSFNSDDAD
jgi:hypothetical protein